MCAYLAWVVFPMVWVAYSSFKDDAAILRAPLAVPVWAEADGAAVEADEEALRGGAPFATAPLLCLKLTTKRKAEAAGSGKGERI